MNINNEQSLPDFGFDEFEGETHKLDLDLEIDKIRQQVELSKKASKSVIDAEVSFVDKMRREIIIRLSLFGYDMALPTSEYRYARSLSVGDKLRVYFEYEERPVCSYRKALMYEHMSDIIKKYVNKSIIKAHVSYVSVFGFIKVDIMGTEAFLPLSQIPKDSKGGYFEYENTYIDVKIVLIDQINWIIYVSNRAVNQDNFRLSYIAKGIKEVEDYLLTEYDYDKEYQRFWDAAGFAEKKSREKKSRMFPDKSNLIRTYGQLSPCPFCGSTSVTTYIDGTAQCNSCRKWYYYG